MLRRHTLPLLLGALTLLPTMTSAQSNEVNVYSSREQKLLQPLRLEELEQP